MSVFREHKTIADRSARDRKRHKQKIEKAIKSEDITLEDAKRVLGWREVQTLFKHQYEKDQARLEWEWEGSWGAKTRRVLNGGPSQWFGKVKKML